MIWRLALGLLVAGAIVVIGLQVRENSGETGATGPTLVLVAPDRTPLPRDSGPENNAPKGNRRPQRSAGKGRPTPGSPHRLNRPAQSPTRAGSRKRSPARKPPKAHSPPRRPDRPEKPGNAPQTQPPAPPRPPVDITAPVPAHGCIKDVGGLNCG